jgi:hypothetical protein
MSSKPVLDTHGRKVLIPGRLRNMLLNEQKATGTAYCLLAVDTQTGQTAIHASTASGWPECLRRVAGIINEQEERAKAAAAPRIIRP